SPISAAGRYPPVYFRSARPSFRPHSSYSTESLSTKIPFGQVAIRDWQAEQRSELGERAVGLRKDRGEHVVGRGRQPLNSRSELIALLPRFIVARWQESCKRHACGVEWQRVDLNQFIESAVSL